MLDYHALRAVDAVIREGSFDRAASALGITPSAVSQRVRGLEDRLGAILISRGQPCVATDLGRTLCAHIAKVLLLEADLAPAFEGSARDPRPPPALKIAVNADSLATWFPHAVATFVRDTGATLDLRVEDEGHTAARLRSGEVLAAVTADREPVQGCRTVPLGTMRYAACASPNFVARYFSDGLDRRALNAAPHARFDRRDALQARWAHAAHDVVLDGPAHWVPSTQAFLDFALAGIAWGLHPVQLARRHLDAGRLLELPPAMPVEVDLYWTVSRLQVTALDRLTFVVRSAASAMLSG